MTSVRETIDSLTGFEELAIAKATGEGLETWSEAGRDLVTTRALAAVLNARKIYEPDPDNPKAKEPTPALINSTIISEYQKIQRLRQTEVAAIFEDEEDEVLEGEPLTESGKDDSPLQDEPQSSLSSV